MKIEVENLTVSYQQLPAVHHISTTFGQGQSWAIVGPNGAGKSTLLKAIVGVLKPDTGRVALHGINRRHIAYLPQMSEVDRAQPMTVYELVASGLWYDYGFFRGIDKKARDHIDQALTRTGMQDYADRLMGELSNGQFQRVLFSRLLIQNADFLLLDEPFNAIDEQTTDELLQLLKQAQQEGRAVIAVLHNLNDVRCHFENCLLIAREKIAAGTTASVLTAEHLARAANFRQDIFDAKVWCQTSENA